MQLRLSRIALIHALCQVPALLVVADFVAESVATAWGRSHRIVGLVAWSIQPLPPKIQSIVEYGLLLAIGAALVLAVTAYARTDRKYVAFSASQWVAFAIYEGACLLPALVFSKSAFAAAAWFFLAMALPAWLASQHLHPSPRVERLFLAASAAGIGFVLWLLFSGSWSPELRFLNDYPDLREYTRMDSGRLVENREYMRDKPVAGRSLVDPCTAQSEPDSPSPGSCLRLPRSVFSGAREAFLLFPPGHGRVYDWDREMLSAHRRLSAGEVALIGAVWGLQRDEAAFARFVATAEDAAAAAEMPRAKTAEEAEFSGKNQSDAGARLPPGGFFSSHARLYLPVLEKVEVAGQSVAPAEYGEGLTRVLGWLLNQTGAPTFQSYYTIYWMALAAYLALMGIVALLITRGAWAGVAAVALGAGALLAIGHDALNAAPGLNPMRHFPDLLCLLAVVVDAQRRSDGSALLRAAAIGLLLWWNLEFGLFFLGGSVAWLLVEIAAGYRRWRGGVRQIVLEGAVASAVLLGAGIGLVGDLRYDPTGPGSSVAGWGYVFCWVLLWTVLIAWLVWARFERPRRDDDGSCGYLIDIAGVGTLYAAFATVYAVWDPSRNNLAAVLLLAVVPFVAVITWAGKQSATGRANFSWLVRYAALVSVAIAAVFAAVDQARHLEFERAFEQHRQFSWNFPGLSGISTADPAVMRESADLIARHQPEGRVLLLSRYDSLLGILTSRAGLLPYADLRGALVSWQMIDKLADQIVRSGAPVLFVDRDVLANREGEIPQISGTRDRVAAHYVGSLAALGLLSRAVGRCYMPGETGGALQVWHRSC